LRPGCDLAWPGAIRGSPRRSACGRRRGYGNARHRNQCPGIETRGAASHPRHGRLACRLLRRRPRWWDRSRVAASRWWPPFVGPAVSGLGPGLFAGAMATGRLLAQNVERSSIAGRMLFAGVAAAGGLALAATTHHAGIALIGFVIAGGGLALSAPTLFGVAGR